MRITLVATGLCLFLLCGCASHLEVYDASGEEAPGVPVHMPQLVKITTETTYEVAPGKEHNAYLCVTEENSKLEFLPLGDRYYISMDPAPLGDAEFGMKFNDAGLLKSLTLNSKATSVADQASELLSTTLSVLTGQELATEEKADSLATPDLSKLKAANCLKVGSKVKVEPYEIQ